MGLDFMSRLHHRVRHGLEDGSVAAGVHCGHCNALQEGELLHSKGLVQVLPLDVLTDVVVGNRGAVVIGGAEVHPGCVVVLIINDVHLIITVVLYVVLFLLVVSALQDHDLLLSFLDHLVLHLGHFRLFEVGVESPAAGILLEKEVLLAFIEVLALKLLVLRGLPLPSFADLDEMVACAFELIG